MSITEDQFETFNLVMDRALELAQRWTKARMGGGYNVSSISYNPYLKAFTFNIVPTTSGMYFPGQLKLSYLFDDSTLEQDAKKELEEEQKKRTERAAKILAFEQSKEFIEYQQAKGAIWPTSINSSCFPYVEPQVFNVYRT